MPLPLGTRGGGTVGIFDGVPAGPKRAQTDTYTQADASEFWLFNAILYGLVTGHLPTYAAEINLGADLTGYFLIGSGLIGTGKLGGPYAIGQWTSLTSLLQSFQTTRGRSDELSGVQPGTTAMLLVDDDGILDPENTMSAYYPNVRMMRQLRVAATWAGTTYVLGYGFLDNLQSVPSPVGADMQAQGTDLFKRLAAQKRSVTFAQQTADVRLHAILDLIQWPAGQRSIDVSPYTLPAITLTATGSQSLLAHIDSVMKATQGDFFIARDGTATYHNHSRRLSAPSRGVFGAGGFPVRTMTPIFRDSLILNEVHVKRSAGVDQVASDTASQVAYDIRTYTFDQSAADCLMSDTQANALANWILGLRAQPSQRIDSIDLDGTGDDNLWPLILGADIGDRITINHDVPGTRGIAGHDYYIESVQHHWSPSASPEHVCTWGLSKAQPLGTYFLIGTSTIGFGRLAY